MCVSSYTDLCLYTHGNRVLPTYSRGSLVHVSPSSSPVFVLGLLLTQILYYALFGVLCVSPILSILLLVLSHRNDLVSSSFEPLLLLSVDFVPGFIGHSLSYSLIRKRTAVLSMTVDPSLQNHRSVPPSLTSAHTHQPSTPSLPLFVQPPYRPTRFTENLPPPPETNSR